jgi:hypothetical protein
MLFDPKWEAKNTKPKWTVPKVYNAAAAAIEKHGHSKGLLVRGDGSMCLWGAMAFAMTGDARMGSSTVLMVDHLAEFIGGENPIKWNNDPQRTKTEVVDLLRHAARVLAARPATLLAE